MGQKIYRVSIKNFKAIESLETEINGNNVLLYGENDTGKTTFIQAIEYSLGLNVQPPEAFHDGANEYSIQVDTGDGEKSYTFTVTAKKGKSPKIEVKGPDGIPTTKKGIISQLVGSIEFDVFEFVEQSKTKTGRQKQVELVKSLLPQETRDELERVKDKINERYQQREEKGREIKTLKGFLENSGLTDEDFENYQLYFPLEEIQTEYNNALKHNQGHDARLKELNEEIPNKKRELNKEITETDQEIEELEAKLKKLKEKRESKQKEFNDLDKRAEQVNEELQNAGDKKDLEAINQRLKDAQEHNKKVDKVAEYKESHEQLEKLQSDYEDLTDRIQRGREHYQKTVRESELPIEGLSFDEETIYFQGYPVDENQISHSQIMLLGAKIKVAQSKNFSVLFLQGLESIGQKKLDQLKKLCQEENFQLIGEHVQRGQEELKVVIEPEEPENQ